MLFSMIAYIGVKNIKDSNVKMNPKNIIIMAAILFIGLAPSYVPAVALAIPVPGTSISLTGLSLAAIVGVILNAVAGLVVKESK